MAMNKKTIISTDIKSETLIHCLSESTLLTRRFVRRGFAL